MRILVTGIAGFVGAFLGARLAGEGHEVLGLDDFNDYYDPVFKRRRFGALCAPRGVHLETLGLEDEAELARVFRDFAPERVYHMAAQAGVRMSIDAPQRYTRSNLVGFSNIIELARHGGVQHFVYASSSSVYGTSSPQPFSESSPCNEPISYYAATKKANEAIAHAYGHLYDLPITGLRLFTVYGPWGRPDMAISKFVHAVYEGREIEVYNEGRHARDFTYIDDVVEAIVRLGGSVPQSGQNTSRIVNIGYGSPIRLLDMIAMIERSTGIRAKLRNLPAQPGDVAETWADITRLEELTGFRPEIPIDKGIERVVDWFQDQRSSA